MRCPTTEFELLVYFMRHHGQVLTREQILSAVWGYEHDPATNVVDVYIGYLRRKLAVGGRAGADRHRALRRLPPGRGHGDDRAAPASGGVWWLGVTGVLVGRRGGHLRRGLRADRHRAARRDRPGGRGRPVAALARRSRGGRAPTRPSALLAQVGRYLRGQPFSATLDAAVRRHPGRTARRAPPPELLGSSAPDNGETVAEQAQENALGAGAAARADAAHHPAGARTSASVQARRARRPRRRRYAVRSAPASRWPSSRAPSAASRARSSSPARWRWSWRLLASYLVGASRVAAAAPDGARGGAGGRRRPAPADGHGPAGRRRGARAGRGVQPHARPPRRGVRGPARVRRRRLARAAHAADRDPRPARGARGPGRIPRRRRCGASSGSSPPRSRGHQRLVDDLLLLARSEQPRVPAVPGVRARARSSPSCGWAAPHRRGAPLRARPGSRRRRCTADPDRLAQALRNLIRNAIEHTRAPRRPGAAAR